MTTSTATATFSVNATMATSTITVMASNLSAHEEGYPHLIDLVAHAGDEDQVAKRNGRATLMKQNRGWKRHFSQRNSSAFRVLREP